jgi:hypothetical protein
MKKDINQYIRVGVDYYRETIIPMTRDNLNILKRWNRPTIVDDFGKEGLDLIKKYDGFCCIPSHVNFKKEINGFYNKYEPISYKMNSNGKWNEIEKLLKHLFGEQYDLGLDYLKILWKHPTQILPILCLVSEERNTGKTTFLNLLKEIFERNMTINTNDDFRSRFNSDWSGKLIIAIDEVLLDKIEDSERIKNLSTALYYKAEAKGRDREEVEFHGKFILCSNNETNFIKIDSSEIRYWVRKIPTLGDAVNPDMLSELRKEIPAFIYFLNTREILTKKTTRMWFSKEQIQTEALDVLKGGNRTSLERELEEMLKDEFAVFEIDTFCYTTKNIVSMLKSRGVNTSSNYVATILKTKYNLENEKNSSYKWYRSEIYSEVNSVANGFTTEKGRYFSFVRSKFGN